MSNIFVTEEFGGSIDIGTDLVTSLGREDAFRAKLPV